MKLTVGLISGSVSIISEAVHSTVDLVASVIAFFSVRISDQPPDDQHPYGHGKFENISGVIEAILIFIAAGWIIYEAFSKILQNKTVESIELGIGVMIISAIINIIISGKLYKVARETESVALEADALHLRTDVYTSAGVAVGLILIRLTGLHFLDPVVAIIVALFILKEALRLFKNAYSPLLDNSLSDDELEIIESAIRKFSYTHHHLRTRRSGNNKFVDFHLEMPENISLKDAHDICDSIEDEIKLRISNAEVTIHPETPGHYH